MSQPAVPDILAALTKERITVAGVLQCALGVFPTTTTLGRPVEGLLLMQNLIDQPLSVQVTIHLPRRDEQGHRLNLFTSRPKMTILLPPAEVGLLHLPVTPQLPSQASDGYRIGVSIAVTPPERFTHLRPVYGGEQPSLLAISPFRAEVLRDVGFGAHGEGDDQLTVTFGVLSSYVTIPDTEPMPRYEALWTVRDLQQELGRAKHMASDARYFARNLLAPDLYPVLVNHTHQAFGHAGMPLHLGEALFIAKVLAYVMTDGLELEQGFSLADAQWFDRLCWLMAHNPDATKTTDQLVAALYPAIVHDGVLLGFYMVEQNTKMALGNLDEQHVYVEKMLAGLAGHLPLGLEHVYVPLVLAGTILVAQIRSPRENPWHSLQMLEEARDGRIRLADAKFNEVFEILNRLIEQDERLLRDIHLPPV